MSQCKDVSYFKERGKRLTILHKKIKNTAWEFKSSDLLPTTCSVIKQQHKSYCKILANAIDSVAKFQVFGTHEINGD